MTAIFRSTTQALFVSFLMEVLPVTTKCPTQTLIDALKAAAGVREDLEERDRTIDFRGLNPMEVRGQCAMVVGACTSHLSAPELAAVHVRFGHRRRQAVGIRALRDYLAPQLGGGNEWMQMALIWNLYGAKGRREDFSLAAIGQEYGIPKSTLGDLQQKIKRLHRALETRAIGALDEYFTRTHLIGTEWNPG